MDNSVYTPEQVLEKIMQAGEKRILLLVRRCVLFGMMAGGFIAKENISDEFVYGISGT